MRRKLCYDNEISRVSYELWADLGQLRPIQTKSDLTKARASVAFSALEVVLIGGFDWKSIRTRRSCPMSFSSQ